MRTIWVVGFILLATALSVPYSCTNRNHVGLVETGGINGCSHEVLHGDNVLSVEKYAPADDVYQITIINAPKSVYYPPDEQKKGIMDITNPVFTDVSESPAGGEEDVTVKQDAKESLPGSFSFGVSGGYGFMYVNADDIRNVPSDSGFNIGIKGLYRVSSVFSVGFGVNFGQYHYDSSGYPEAYTVIDPVFIAEVTLSVSERIFFTIGLNAGADIRMYEDQKGVYPTVMANLEVGYRVSDSISVGIGATGGITIQNYELDSKITAGGVLRVSF